jgi:hypothetical protein
VHQRLRWKDWKDKPWRQLLAKVAEMPVASVR